MQEVLRSYLETALGVTQTSRKKATEMVDKLLQQGGMSVDQAKTVVDDVISTSAANREALGQLVRYEVDQTLSRVGLATREEIDTLNARIEQLEQQLRDAERRLITVEDEKARPKPVKKTAPSTAKKPAAGAKKATKKATKKAAKKAPSAKE